VPEGPEIRRAADAVARVLAGNEIVEVGFGLRRLRRYRRALEGAVVTAVDTRGKAMLTRFDNGLTLYSHNQLYGRWYTGERGYTPETGRSLRVALHTATHSALLYSASDIEVLNDAGVARHPFLSGLGPDVLDGDLAAGTVAERLRMPGFRGRALASLYLDQGFLAGIGNYLRSEILFVAGLEPSLRPGELSPVDLARLARATLSVSRRSYRTAGVTVTRDLEQRLCAAGEAFEDYRFWVFGRDGLPCRRCGTTVVRYRASSRGLYVCPSCQAR